jgi:hypothetical protein
VRRPPHTCNCPRPRQTGSITSQSAAGRRKRCPTSRKSGWRFIKGFDEEKQPRSQDGKANRQRAFPDPTVGELSDHIDNLPPISALGLRGSISLVTRRGSADCPAQQFRCSWTRFWLPKGGAQVQSWAVTQRRGGCLGCSLVLPLTRGPIGFGSLCFVGVESRRLLGEDLKPGTQSDVVQDVARGGVQGTGPGFKGAQLSASESNNAERRASLSPCLLFQGCVWGGFRHVVLSVDFWSFSKQHHLPRYLHTPQPSDCGFMEALETVLSTCQPLRAIQHVSVVSDASFFLEQHPSRARHNRRDHDGSPR